MQQLPVVPRYLGMSDITYSALFIIILVQFIEFDFFSIILILVIQYSMLLQHIDLVFQYYSFDFCYLVLHIVL